MKKILLICVIALLASGCVARPRAIAAPAHGYCRNLGFAIGTQAFANCVARYETFQTRRRGW